MRAIVAAVVAAGSVASAAPAVPADVVAVYWEPPGHPAAGPSARAAFAEAVKPLHARFVDATTPAPVEESLVPELDQAKRQYAQFQFTDAIATLDDLDRRVVEAGGGDLDRRQLSEIYFYRGLSRLETLGSEAAFDDLVHAAHLAPDRRVDAASFPPTAVARYNAAAADAARTSRAPLTIVAPRDAVVRFDGERIAGTLDVSLSAHFVSVEAPGYERWAGVISAVTGTFTPQLRPWQPPDGDRLLALAGEPPPRQILLGALVRDGNVWRFVARDVTLPDGKFTSDATTLGDVPVAVAVRALVHRLVPSIEPERPRWMWWAIAGATAVAGIALGVGIGIAATTSTESGTAGGKYTPP